MSITSMANGDQSATAGKRKTPEAANQSGSAKRPRANTGPSNNQNGTHKPAGGGLRVTIKPVSHSSVLVTTSTASSSALSTPIGTPGPSSDPVRRRRPIRSHVPQQSTSATRGQSEPSPTIASPASLSHKVAPYTVIDGYSFELQNDQCHKKEYRLAQRCTNCNVKQPGSVCLFQGSRVFVVPKPPSNSIDRTTPTFFATYQPQGSHSKIRSVFNRSLNNDQRNRIAGALSFSMHPTLTQAINHANLPKSILRPNDENDGRKCFYCHGPLFLSYWFCGGCGRDYCPACYDAIRDCLPSEGELLVATDPQSALRAAKHGSDSEANSSSLSQTSMTPIEEHIDVERRYLHDLERLPESVQVQKESITDSMTQKLLTCARRRLHGEDHFIPVTTCSASDLDCIAEECDRLNANRKQLLHSQPGTSEAAQDQPVRTPFSEAMTWETQKPTLITGVGEKLEIDWTPENFCNAFARITCQVQDSQSLHRRDMLVRDFFQQYGSTRKRGDILTIDNWPQTSELASWQPDLYEDFVQSLPLPDYTRPDGARNLASMVPLNIRNLDIGPKIFCSYRSKDVSQVGSVRLRTSAVDTLNVLMYASDTDGQPGEVLWNIWPPSSINILRTYCYEFLARVISTAKRPTTAEDMKRRTDDPVYLQIVAYLGPEARTELEKRGAKAWTIRQKVGEAVTVPAGCPFQVCCLADSISVNTDFLSPESLEKCLGHSSEFQRDTITQTWKQELFRMKTVAYHALRAYTPDLSKVSHAADRSKESVARPARQAVPSASTVRVGGKRRGRPPLNSLKKAETARSRSPTSYISVNYEQPPTSDIRSRTETPAPSPLTSGSIKGSNSLASQSHEKAQRESGPLPESAASKVAQSDTITTVPSIDGERGIQLDPDSPVISRRPLPKLRGRSPSDIEPVLKPSTNSGIRTLPASSLPKDQKAFQLENQPPTRRAEPQPQTQAPEDVPPTVQPSASEKDLAASVPRASVPLTESVNANSSARPSVPLPKQAPPPPIHTGTAIPQTVPSPANPHHKEAPPGARSQGPGVHEKTAGVAALGTNVGRQVSPTRQQTSTKTAEPRTLGSLDRTVLKKILADAKGVLEDIYDITPNEEAQLAVILDDVVRYCQSLHNSTNPQQNLKVYPEKVQERLKAVSAGLVMLSLPTISEPASLREQRISAVALACRKAVVTVFACHKSREEQNKGTLTQTGTTAAASPIGPQLQASHEPRTPSGHHRHPQNVEQANSGDPSRVASQPKAGQLEPSKHPHLQSASQASQPHTSPGSSAAHPHGEPGRILAFPQETPVISPVDTRPQVTSASPALRSSNDTTNVQYISRGAVGPSRLSPVVPQHHTMVQSTSRTHSAAGTSVVSRGAVPANASQENRSRPMTLPGAQSGGSPITCSPFDRIPYHVQVAEDIPFTTAAPPPPPPASGPPLSMMEQLALDYARFG